MNHVKNLRRSVALSCLLAAACQAEERTLWGDGEFVRYLSSTDQQPCAGTPIVANDFVAFVAHELGIRLPPKIEYHWLNAEDFVQSDCPPSRGCAFATEVYGHHSMNLHELVHSIGLASGMNDSHFFNEGLATAYDPLSGIVVRFGYARDFTKGLEDPRPQMTAPREALNYRTAGNFVAFLLARHGPEKLVAISQSSDRGDDLDTIRSKFRAVYPTELDDEAELYMASGELDCDEDHFNVRPQDCTMPEVEWSGEEWTHEGTLDCDDEDVTGAYKEFSVRSVTLAVPETGQYLVRTSGDGRRHVRIGRCFGCPWQHDDVLIFPGPNSERMVTLEAGAYFVRTEAATRDQAPLVGVTMTRVP